MHYERHLIQQQTAQESHKAVQSVNPPHMAYPNMMMPMRPMMPGGVMPNYPQQYPFPMYRWPYPGMVYPPTSTSMQTNLNPTDESKK
jgi:hypothetical protein